MKYIDSLLQSWRIFTARPYIPPGGRVLDIGCYQGELFSAITNQLEFGIGMDPLAKPRFTDRYVLLPLAFQGCLPFASNSLDAIIMLATLEHILDTNLLASECQRVLRSDGRVIITVPDIKVDKIVDFLTRLHIIDGMSLDEHHGFRPQDTPLIFCRHGFKLEVGKTFQLGLNYLYVFRKLP